MPSSFTIYDCKSVLERIASIVHVVESCVCRGGGDMTKTAEPKGNVVSKKPVGWLWNRLKSPETVTDSLQILKSVVAATGAWWLSVYVLNSQMPFLAPWTALLVVHATVHRSLSRGLQTTVASTEYLKLWGPPDRAVGDHRYCLWGPAAVDLGATGRPSAHRHGFKAACSLML